MSIVLPMGTIMAAIMLLGVVFATRLPPLNTLAKAPLWFRRIVSAVVFLGGAWNVFWYAFQHISEFWGQAALVSGLLMMVTSLYIYQLNPTPKLLQQVRPVVILALLGCALLYGITIIRL